jgi:hypothetical protein
MNKINIEDLEYKKVEVTWLDAISGFQEPLTPSELIRQLPAPTKSIGYLIHEDKDKIILGFMLFDFKYIKHWQLIPKGMIIDMSEVKDVADLPTLRKPTVSSSPQKEVRT